MLSDNELCTTDYKKKKKRKKKSKQFSSSVALLFCSLTRTVNKAVDRHLQVGISIAIKCH